MSIVLTGRPDDHEIRYEQPRRPTIIRNPSYEVGSDDRHYAQRAPSPTSPRYMQRALSPVSPRYARPVNDFDNERYDDESYVTRGDNVRVIDHPNNQRAANFENFARPREPVTRLQSVRPVSHYEVPRVPSVRPEHERIVRPMPAPYEASRIQSLQPEHDRMVGMRPITSQYEMPREQFARVHSVRPEQERIVSIGGRREVGQRQVSVRPEDTYMTLPGPVGDERPRYTYVPEAQSRRYVSDDVFNDRVVYEASAGGNRRVIQ